MYLCAVFITLEKCGIYSVSVRVRLYIRAVSVQYIDADKSPGLGRGIHEVSV